MNQGKSTELFIMKLSNSLSNIVVFIISIIIFNLIVYLPVPADIIAHVKKAMSDISINFLYYISINTFALFSKNLHHMLISAIFILSLAITAKFMVTKAIIYDYFKEKKDSKKLLLWLAPLSSFLLLFSFNLLSLIHI